MAQKYIFSRDSLATQPAGEITVIVLYTDDAEEVQVLISKEIKHLQPNFSSNSCPLCPEPGKIFSSSVSLVFQHRHSQFLCLNALILACVRRKQRQPFQRATQLSYIGNGCSIATLHCYTELSATCSKCTSTERKVYLVSVQRSRVPRSRVSWTHWRRMVGPLLPTRMAPTILTAGHICCSLASPFLVTIVSLWVILVGPS